jgi:hypothetical protein
MTLPLLDEHAVDVEAPADRVWSAIERWLPRVTGGRSSKAAARTLGCRDLETTVRSPVAVGATVPGFRVADVEAQHLLGLEGEHRFSRYRLTLRVDDLGGGRSRLRAETRAEFPDLPGKVYRALLIGTRGHVLAVRRLLRAIKRRAESRQPLDR